jgi:hypothetical protein
MVQPRQNHTEIALDLFVIQKRGAIVDVEGKLKDRMVEPHRRHADDGTNGNPEDYRRPHRCKAEW